ncbi:hypothetical protein REPUB_Repub07fG0095200 [Reevesia pubescens]
MNLMNNHVFEDVEEGEIVDDGSISDDDCFEEGVDGPCISLTKEDKQRFRKPWKNQSSSNCWVELLVTLRRWTLGFRSNDATIDTVAAWIRFPGFPLEYYDSSILIKMGNEIDKAVKIDRTTSNMLRGKFARLCVKLDLAKPLISKIFIGGRWQKMEYDMLKMLCFYCAKKSYRKPPMPKHANNGKQSEKIVEQRDDIVSNMASGSRFAALACDEDITDDMEVVPNSLDVP